MFFLSHYTQINPKINPCKIKFVVEGAVYNALRLMWAIGIGSFVILTSTLNPQLHSRSATYIKRNGLLIRKITIKSSRPFQCAYHPLTP